MSRCHHILQLLLVFAERNPGITRILNGDALLGEHDRLRDRISILFDKLETQIKQVLRDGCGKARASSSTTHAGQPAAGLYRGAASASSSARSSKIPRRVWKISGSLSAASCKAEPTDHQPMHVRSGAKSNPLPARRSVAFIRSQLLQS